VGNEIVRMAGIGTHHWIDFQHNF